MEPSTSLSDQPTAAKSVQVQRCDRWQVYQRLQDLDIDCTCPTNGGLQVAIPSPTAMAQLWSVIQSCKASRQTLVDYLDRCWQIAGDSPSQ